MPEKGVKSCVQFCSHPLVPLERCDDPSLGTICFAPKVAEKKVWKQNEACRIAHGTVQTCMRQTINVR